MVPRENKNNAYAKLGGTKKEYYGIFRTGLYTLYTIRYTLYAVVKFVRTANDIILTTFSSSTTVYFVTRG